MSRAPDTTISTARIDTASAKDGRHGRRQRRQRRIIRHLQRSVGELAFDEGSEGACEHGARVRRGDVRGDVVTLGSPVDVATGRDGLRGVNGGVELCWWGRRTPQLVVQRGDDARIARAEAASLAVGERQVRRELVGFLGEALGVVHVADDGAQLADGEEHLGAARLVESVARFDLEPGRPVA